jgi:hypothetical protein
MKKHKNNCHFEYFHNVDTVLSGMTLNFQVSPFCLFCVISSPAFQAFNNEKKYNTLVRAAEREIWQPYVFRFLGRSAPSK